MILPQNDIQYFQKRTNGMVFDLDCNPLTEIDYPDLYYYDRDKALWAKTFIETVGVVTEDGHIFKKGDPIKLLPWQVQTVCNLFGVLRKEDGLRRYWHVTQLLPKKMGKSPFASFIALLLLCADNQGTAEIFVIACDKQQAAIIHNNAKKLVNSSPILSRILNSRSRYIEHVPSESRFWITGTIEDSKHGPNLAALFVDEPHAFRHWSIVETLEQGIAARPQPVVMFTSTAGVRGSHFHTKIYKSAKGLLNGSLRNDSELVFIYEADVQHFRAKFGAEWWSHEEVWIDTNPSYGVTVSKYYFQNEVNKIRNGTRSLNRFLQMHLNIFTGNTESWPVAGAWPLLSTFDLKKSSNLEGFGSVYTGNPQSMTAACFLSTDGHITFKILCAQEFFNAQPGHVYQTFLEQDAITIIPGNYIGIDDHFFHFTKFFKQFKLRHLAFRSGDESIGVKLCEENGYKQELLRIKASRDILNATREFEDRVFGKLIIPDGNPVVPYQLEMTEILTAEDNRRPSVKYSSDNICTVMAAIIACVGYTWTTEAVQKYSTKITSLPKLF